MASDQNTACHHLTCTVVWLHQIIAILRCYLVAVPAKATSAFGALQPLKQKRLILTGCCLPCVQPWQGPIPLSRL